ncbi:hypothetical protein RQM59_01735 [Flavobacteriaceae bacterium S356]|uniref:Uncharacterized protein n=1 Tax=Asprobacillus argus TaxID=3076534 RepID=A0ABU3LBV1_9FLAO|nr:hypothetical protein [Flavobacteriaceae bacterium S356]
MKKTKHLMLIIFLFKGILSFGQDNSAYKVIYEADRKGNAISGSLEELIKYVNNGNPIRVGWSLAMQMPDKEVIEMWHWTDANFITTLNGNVFAQVKGIFQQGPSFSASGTASVVLVSDASANSWVGIIGTTGVMHQKFAESKTMTKMYKDMGYSDEKIKEEYKKQETMKFKTKWTVLTSSK